MNNQLTSPVARLGRRMVDFALDSAGGRGQIERSLVEHHHSPAATALAPIAWFESSLLWVGLRLSGPPVLTSR